MDYEIGQKYTLWYVGQGYMLGQGECIFAGHCPSTGSAVFLWPGAPPQILGKTVWEDREGAVQWAIESSEANAIIQTQYARSTREYLENPWQTTIGDLPWYNRG